MPCDCSYMEPGEQEIELTKVVLLLDELDGKGAADPQAFHGGSDKRIYNKCISKKDADAMVKKLCDRLSKVRVGDYSLEMQVWWRDHIAEDRKRLERELRDADDKKAKKAAISKLTPHERRVLGI